MSTGSVFEELGSCRHRYRMNTVRRTSLIWMVSVRVMVYSILNRLTHLSGLRVVRVTVEYDDTRHGIGSVFHAIAGYLLLKMRS
jgi:hypothetical protein